MTTAIERLNKTRNPAYYAIAAAVRPAYVEIFRQAGIKNTDALFERAATIKGRQELAAEINIPADEILRSVTIADLLRIKRLGTYYIHLLRLAGVRTVRELRYRNSHKLMQDIVNANALHNVVQLLPSIKFVAGWIEQAKQLPIKISYR